MKFIKKLAVRQEVLNEMDNNIKKATALLETSIRKRTPVITGNLRGHIDGRITGFASGEVATNVEYAEKVEYGGGRQSPRAMFRLGAIDVEKRGLAIFN